MITADFHMHTYFSADSDALPEEMVKSSIKKGIKTICFTDHYDKDYVYTTGEAIFDCEAYFSELTTLRERYREEIEIKIGVEIGLLPNLANFYNELVKKHPFDFVIGSVHVVDGHDLSEKALFQDHKDEKAFEIVLTEMLQDVKTDTDFDVLGHIDYMVRYGKHQARDFSYALYAGLIDEILNYLIENGKGIEINMSGFKYGIGFCHPHPEIIKRYRELGGEIITVGADGHRPEHVAYEFDKTAEILKSCGFKYYTEFSDRKPIFKHLS